jgi:hypothetical protein
MLAVNYDLNRSLAECIVEIVFAREEDQNGFAGALNDLGPMIRGNSGNKGWTDPEEPNVAAPILLTILQFAPIVLLSASLTSPDSSTEA